MQSDIVDLAGDQFLDLQKNCCILLKFALHSIHVLDICLNGGLSNVLRQHLTILEESHNLRVLEPDPLLLSLVLGDVSE